jgi:agmatine deiminase
MAFGDVLSENLIEKETATRLAENLTILKRSRNADGKPFYIIFLPLVPPQISAMKKGDGTYDILQSMTFKPELKYGFKDKPEKMIAAASYLNFVIINRLVLVPFYDLETDEKAMVAFKKAFPDKKIVPINPLALNWGGGGMHCITQNEPF